MKSACIALALALLAFPQQAQAVDAEVLVRNWQSYVNSRIYVRDCDISNAEEESFICNIHEDGKLALAIPAHNKTMYTQEYREMLQHCATPWEAWPTCTRLVTGYLYEKDGKPALGAALVHAFNAGRYSIKGN